MITKSIKYVSLALGLTLAVSACDDQIMEWKTPDGHGAVTAAEIPLEIKEVLANYDDLKAYAAENHPGMVFGLGVGKDIYMGEDGRHELAAQNFQMVTWGNAMKSDALLKNNGTLDFASLDPALDAIKEDGLRLWGHNFFWHTQQNQTYLKSLIAPKFVVESDSDIKNLLGGDSFDFEGGTKGKWKGQGGNNPTVGVSSEGEGYNSKYAIVLDNPTDGGSGSDWKAQCLYEFDLPLEQGKEYTLRFKAKCSVSGGSLQFILQNADYSNQEGWGNRFDTTTDWAVYEKVITPSKDDLMRIVFNFGSVTATYYIDDIEFGEKIANPDEGRKNLIKNSTFDEDANDWAKWNGADDCKTWNETEGNLKAGCMQVVNAADNPGNQWKVQIHANLLEIIPKGTKFYVSYYIKCASGSGSVRCSTTGNAHYQGDQTVGTGWQRVEWTIDAAGGDIEGLNFDLAQVANTYYIDDVVVSTDPFNGSEAKAPRKAKSYYVAKTAEEKAAALTAAMELWVKGVADHLAEKNIVPYGYDVINEAIADGNGNEVRGFNNVFGGSWKEDDKTYYDAAPTENEQDGLELNWGSGHFYWGYYVPDYAVKAFEFARQYLPAETKLFYNDYNLETSDTKRAAAIKFVQDIDAAHGSAIVDGIGTQMHITLSGTSDDTDNNAQKVAELKERVAKQFQELASTGKLIRITELDIALGTSSPSAAQWKAQADAYKAIFEAYFENVPEQQQSGITIWSLTDNEDEHEYWLKGELPNLFDAKGLRKWAYKGVADALAGEDLGLKFGGEDYKAFYEKQNVSDTVK